MTPKCREHGTLNTIETCTCYTILMPMWSGYYLHTIGISIGVTQHHYLHTKHTLHAHYWHTHSVAQEVHYLPLKGLLQLCQLTVIATLHL